MKCDTNVHYLTLFWSPCHILVDFCFLNVSNKNGTQLKTSPRWLWEQWSGPPPAAAPYALQLAISCNQPRAVTQQCDHQLGYHGNRICTCILKENPYYRIKSFNIYYLHLSISVSDFSAFPRFTFGNHHKTKCRMCYVLSKPLCQSVSLFPSWWIYPVFLNFSAK